MQKCRSNPRQIDLPKDARPVVGIDQLAGDANFFRRLAHAPFKHVAHAKLAPDLLDIDGMPFEGEARIAGDDEQRS